MIEIIDIIHTINILSFFKIGKLVNFMGHRSVTCNRRKGNILQYQYNNNMN